MVVRMRSNHSHTGNRRSHHALTAGSISNCPDCKAPILPHNVCKNCGKYQGRQVLDVKSKLEKREKKLKARSAEAKK